jgi:AcrR family transcriptional regulator
MLTSALEIRDDLPTALEDGAHADPVTHSGRRDRKKLATRRALRDAALELVASRGFAHVTVEDIADAADVATRTFFNYFPSKESAVIGADPERIEQLGTNLLARPAEETPLEALGSVLVDYAANLDEDLDDLGGEGKKAWFQRFCIVRADPELLGAYAAHMAENERGLSVAMAERLGSDPYHDPYPALVTATALAAVRVAAMYWSANGGEESLARLTRAAIDSLGKGLLDPGPVLGESRAPAERLRASTGQRSQSRQAK